MHFCVRIFGQVQEDCVSQGWAFLFSKFFSCFGRGLGLRLGADWRARSTMFAEIWGFSLLEIAVFQRRTMTKRCLSVAHEENAEKTNGFPSTTRRRLPSGCAAKTGMPTLRKTIEKRCFVAVPRFSRGVGE